MQKEVDRLVPPDEMSQLMSLAMGIFTIPKRIDRVEGLVVFPGMGEVWRIMDAISFWQEKGNRARYLLISGHNMGEKTAQKFDSAELQKSPFNLKKLEGVISETAAEHSRDYTNRQAEWVWEKTKELELKSIALFVSPYFIIRAYLTLLKTFLRHGGELVAIIPKETPISLDHLIPETQTDAWSLVPGEIERIRKYQAQGDVAILEELKEYLSWLWIQPIITEKEA